MARSQGLRRNAIDARTMQQLRPTIKPVLAALASLDRLLKRAAEEFNAAPSRPARQAAAILASRLADDLHAFALLAERHYRLQAMTIASSAVEAAWTIIYIGSDDERARSWSEHPGLKSTTWRPKQLTKAVGVEDASWMDTIYTFLCAAKHHNPHMLQLFFSAHTLQGHLLESDPSFSPRAAGPIKLIASMLLQPALCALGALSAHGVTSPKWEADLRRALRRHEGALRGPAFSEAESGSNRQS
jgi:hypothetical protein